MDELDDAQMVEAVRQAAADARDPTQRRRLSAAAAIFAALARRDSREREALGALLAQLVKARRVYVQLIETDGTTTTAEATCCSSGDVLTVTSDRRKLLAG